MTTLASIPMTAQTELSHFIRQQIKAMDVSEREAARQWEIPQATLNKILNKPGHVPSLATLERLSVALKVPLQKLVALCGFAIDELTRADRALLGMNEQQTEWWLNLSPSRRAHLLDALRRLHGDAEDPEM